MNLVRYRDRRSAGKALAQALEPVMQPDAVILALPRGGVHVAVEVAAAFAAPLDVFIVHKLAPIESPDQIVGAVTSRGVCVLNRAVLQEVVVDPAALAEAIASERERVEERETLYRGRRRAVSIENKPVVLVADGLPSSVTLRAAVAAIKKQSPSWVVVAAPVGMPEVCEQIGREAEAVVCPLQPDPFFSIGLSYEQFPRLSDDEICDLLDEADTSRILQDTTGSEDSFDTPYFDGARF